jgi:hypothetical protein
VSRGGLVVVTGEEKVVHYKKVVLRWEMEEDSVDGRGMVMMVSVDERQEDKVREG